MKDILLNKPDVLVIFTPHPFLFLRGEWLAITISKIFNSDIIVLHDLPVKRPIVMLPILNMMTLIKVLLKRRKYRMALTFNCLLKFPALYILKKVGLIKRLVFDDADYAVPFTKISF